jgi:hypothetical protein
LRPCLLTSSLYCSSWLVCTAETFDCVTRGRDACSC